MIATMPLFHITGQATWAAAVAEGVYTAPSLAAVGFLHLSTAAQVPRTLARFFAGQRDLVVVAIDDAHPAIAAALRYEPADGEDFPHLYAPLPIAATLGVTDAEAWRRDP